MSQIEFYFASPRGLSGQSADHTHGGPDECARMFWQKSNCIECCGPLELFPTQMADCCVDSQKTIRALEALLEGPVLASFVGRKIVPGNR